MEELTNVGQNFGLNADEFDSLLKKLQDGNEYLIEVIFKSHFEICRKFLVRKLGVTSEIAYDITLDTIVKFRKNLLLGKIRYGNLAALFTIDARNTYLRWNKKETKYQHVSVESYNNNIPDDDDDDDDDGAELNLELASNLKVALTKVGNECFEILQWHYYLGMPLKNIAESRLERGDEKFTNEFGVKTKIAECRKKLRNLLS